MNVAKSINTPRDAALMVPVSVYVLAVAGFLLGCALTVVLIHWMRPEWLPTIMESCKNKFRTREEQRAAIVARTEISQTPLVAAGT